MIQNTQTVSPLRQRMIEDMMLRKLSPKTQSAYIRAVKKPRLIHVPPNGFHRIRHYGLIANANRQDNLAHARKLLRVNEAELAVHEKTTDEDQSEEPRIEEPRQDASYVCPDCGAPIIIIETFPRNRQPGWKTMYYLLKANAYTVFIARVNRDFINPHRGLTTLIPTGQYPKLTASPHPAVSSLEAYQTPAR